MLTPGLKPITPHPSTTRTYIATGILFLCISCRVSEPKRQKKNLQDKGGLGKKRAESAVFRTFWHSLESAETLLFLQINVFLPFGLWTGYTQE